VTSEPLSLRTNPIFLFLAQRGSTMMRAVVRVQFFLLVLGVVLAVVGAGPAQGQNIIAQYALGGATGETTMGKDLTGRSGIGWEATAFDPNVTAGDTYLSDSIPPSNEDYIEDPPTGPLYGFPILRLEPGNNSNTPTEAVTKDKYFAFTVTAADGFTLNLSSLTFDAARGGAATPRGWVLLSDVDGFTTPIDQQDVPTQRPDLTHFAIDLSGPSYQGLTEVTFRMYSYLPGGGRSVEYSNVTLNGTVQ
jgi:hypothetical protein